MNDNVTFFFPSSWPLQKCEYYLRTRGLPYIYVNWHLETPDKECITPENIDESYWVASRQF